MTSKFYRVSKVKNRNNSVGHHWKYSLTKNKREILLRYSNLEDLKINVLYLGLPWGLKEIKEDLQINDNEFEKIYEKFKKGDRPYSNMSKYKYKNKSGIKRVRKRKRSYNEEFYYTYRIRIDGRECSFSAPTIEELKDRIVSMDLPWETV